jgi:CheY-like chemotaxis protein
MTGIAQAVTIVMIEDDEGHARLIQKNVRRAGIHNEIVHFTHGNAALDYLLGTERSGLARAGQPHLILLDLNLPDMTGIDILRKVKSNPHSHRIPVVILTTTDDKVEIDKCYELGANVYITKPVDYEGFATAIKSLGLFLSVIQIPEG